MSTSCSGELKQSLVDIESGSKFDLPIIWTNLVDLEFPMLYTKIQPQSFLDSKDFKCFTIFGHGGHLDKWRGTIPTNCNPFDRRPNVKSG